MTHHAAHASIKLQLPATSANLGPGFDAAAIALNFHLKIEAEAADAFSIDVSGRNADLCGLLENNLILETYKKLLTREGKSIIPLSIRMRNEIPLGMGCGSSAAGRLAAILLAVHFGQLDWSSEQILEEAYLLEGHPDNAAACWLGGFVAAACQNGVVHVGRVAPPERWRAIVVLPADPLPTSKARAVLPTTYSSQDAVANIQAASLLGLAFAQERGDLLAPAMHDRIHQPYREAICPLLPILLPLVGKNGVIGVALSGAGPSILIIVEGEQHLASASAAIRAAVKDPREVELLACHFETVGGIQVFKRPEHKR